ncbi:glycosyl hydrolase family 18 protein [Paenibacillus gansuensis]|uniref:Glycosyl hydrolase family 18 protein n=1 Tax=Paenibacillus gansuensis TaxID=306542 RepID=A0ABW5PM98_9BACL
MDLEIRQRRHTGRRRGRSLWVVCLLIAALASYAAYELWLAPNREHVKPDFHGWDKPVFYQGVLLEKPAQGTKESLLLPLESIQKHLDPGIIYEASTESVILTTDSSVLRLRTEQRTGQLNTKPFPLHFPVRNLNGDIYVPIAPLKLLYGLKIEEDTGTGAVIIKKAGDRIQHGYIGSSRSSKTATYPVRNAPSRRAPIVADAVHGQKAVLWGETDGWYEVQLPNGIQGYVPVKQVTKGTMETVAEPVKNAAFVPWKPKNGLLNMTWEHVTRTTPDPSKFVPMPGLNVISPTWFELMDGQGTIRSRADLGYVKWANSKGIQIWALFSNGFDPDWTSAALSTYERRMAMVKQLLTYAEVYGLQGINLDFENVYLKDKDLLTQFVKELTPLLHERKLVVSIDVTPVSSSEMWSLFYDRKQLSQSVDYIMLMAYDEHWASSPEAGSVSSLPWAERHVVHLLEKEGVPASKLVLGIPFYTRLWEEKQVNGETKVSSKALSMDKINLLIKEKKLQPSFLSDIGQHYVEFEENGNVYKAWLEDAVSIKARVQLVHKYGLAGTASWRRGFETPDIWNVINRESAQKP